MSDPHFFDVLSVGELREKYYKVDEQPPLIKINSEKVPDPLHCLIPLAERWGISDDMLRLDALQKASTDDVKALRDAVQAFDDSLDEWLAGPEATGDTFSPEYLAFTHMRMASDGC